MDSVETRERELELELDDLRAENHALRTEIASVQGGGERGGERGGRRGGASGMTCEEEYHKSYAYDCFDESRLPDDPAQYETWRLIPQPDDVSPSRARVGIRW